MYLIGTAWKTIKLIISSSIRTQETKQLFVVYSVPESIATNMFTLHVPLNEWTINRMTQMLQMSSFFLLFRIDYEATLKKFIIHIRIAFDFVRMYAD